ncbi:hypothetical protein ASPACDRAFT_45812 [Aspergillus aculeatus ATCC 16872]|uniref:Rhodopsin domain-containing protein n=1 Tax=Aspergillus aculeatus (strain ATCC 16872 / CBS 172.66 / WB 5094) TaxID=690307 RepID=A0A1L9WNG5_ASPA1|nr:uncharacterized protein ASPACDRAFT_45812 [Aspergillus aculeatus ATCC 16872]OJJ97715.1 hypothetical protein ASPACDRAFT_45812 [Aspergillus aculeatus ATCC 16872]
MTYTSLPKGISPPLAENNAHNHAGLIIIFASVCLFLVLSSLAMRVYATTQRSMALSDDYLLGVAVAVAIAQISVVLYQTHLGWGKSSELLDQSSTERMDKSAYASDLLYLMVLGLSKCCTSLLYQHLTTHAARWIPRSLLGVSIIWTIVSVILVGIRCSRTQPWTDINDNCRSLQPHWTATTALDILLEILLFIYPIRLIYSLRLRRSRKLTVLSLLGSRGILLIPLTTIHYRTLLTQLHSPNPTLQASTPTILKELYLATSILLLTLSSFKMLIAVYEDDDGLAYYTSDGGAHNSKSRHQNTTRNTRDGGGGGGGGGGGSRSSRHYTTKRPRGGLQEGRGYSTDGTGGGDGGGGGGDTIEEEPILGRHAWGCQQQLGMMGMGIRKDVQIEVTSEVVIELEERGVSDDQDARDNGRRGELRGSGSDSHNLAGEGGHAHPNHLAGRIGGAGAAGWKRDSSGRFSERFGGI